MPRRLTEPERELWERVARTVRRRAPATPLAPPSIPASDASREVASPPLAPAKAGTRRAPATEPGPDLRRDMGGGGPVRQADRKPAAQAPAPPADISHLRRVRRGKIEPDARLDLHGMTQDAARAALLAFIRRQRGDGAASVLVITGKGRSGGGVLRARLGDWLAAADFREHVAGWSRAHLRHGGDGAFYLTLRRRTASATPSR